MVGRDLADLYPKASAATPGEVAAAVERLTREGVFTDSPSRSGAGEIVALAGLVGAGRSEVARAVFGIDRYDAGTVAVARPARCAGRRRPRRWPPGSRSSPRTAASRAWSWTCRSQRNIALAVAARG